MLCRIIGGKGGEGRILIDGQIVMGLPGVENPVQDLVQIPHDRLGLLPQVGDRIPAGLHHLVDGFEITCQVRNI